MAARDDDADIEIGEDDEEDAYVLDVDDDDETDVEALTRQALEAVERVERGSGEFRPVELPPGTVPGLGAASEDEQIARLEAELAELRDRSVRTLADFENYRRRADREHREQRRYALTEYLTDFLPVVDNLERALAAGGEIDDLKAGVEMICRQMKDLLRQHGVEAVESQGASFDPAVHEAVAREESPEVDAPTVVEVLQRGYRIHDRLLRPARVRVAMPEDEEAGDA